MNKTLLAFENVSYTAGKKKILSDVNWRVKKGEHWVILGPNGAGKSTMLRLIYGFIWPNASGRILRQGRESLDLGELRKSIGWVAEELLRLIPRGETAIETVLSGKNAQFGFWQGEGCGCSASDRKKALSIMRELRIEKFAKKTTMELSQGETQKIMLARALMSSPYLIMLDEALAGLDPGAREEFLETLNDYMKKNSEPSFVLITHHIDEITEGFKNLLVLKDGRVIYTGAASRGLSDSLVTKLYGRRFRLERSRGRWRLK
jgi:iron complex transport system ATP-binding protein